MGRNGTIMKKILLSALLGILYFACDRILEPTPTETKYIDTFYVSIPDPAGYRANKFELSARDIPGIYNSLVSAYSYIPHKEINSPDDTIFETVNLADFYAFDFAKYNYDYIAFELPDPSYSADISKNSYKDKCRFLEFGVYKSTTQKIVPMVIITKSFLFRYPKPLS